MQRTSAVLGTAIFFVVAPLLAAGIIPWWITRWQFRPPFLGLELTRAIGVVLIVAGVPGIVDSFARFALQGLGTPAPVAPPQKLVVTGLYRYVRNPMYVSVLGSLLAKRSCSAIGDSSSMPRCSGWPATRTSPCTKSGRCSTNLGRCTMPSTQTSRAGSRDYPLGGECGDSS